MSILDTIRQNVKSLDDYAKLPQNILMSMAQKGQIPQNMLAPILARKSEMADAAAAMRAAAESRNAPQGSIIEQLMAKNSEAERARTPRDMGVAALPVRDDMYSEQSFAGGGIVAFQNNQDQPVNEYMPQVGETENEYLQRVRAISEMGSEFFNPRNYNPLAKGRDLYNLYQEKIGQPFAAGVRRFVSEPLGEQADRFRRASAARENIGKRAAGTPTTEKEVKRMMPADKIDGSEQALFDAERAVRERPVSRPAAGTGEAKSLTSKMAAEAAATPPAEKVDPFAEQEKMLRQQGEDSKKAREEAKYMRLLEAGLGIMGGTSPYALTNIGAGAIGAAKGYAQDVKEMRAEERDRIKELSNIATKRRTLDLEAEKLGIDKDYKTKMVNLAERELEIKRILANKSPETVTMIERYAAARGIDFATAADQFFAGKKGDPLSQFMTGMGKPQEIDRQAVLTKVQNFLAGK